MTDWTRALEDAQKTWSGCPHACHPICNETRRRIEKTARQLLRARARGWAEAADYCAEHANGETVESQGCRRRARELDFAAESDAT